MPKKFSTSVDLQQNELQNAKLHVLASAPGSPATGQVWFNSTTGKIEFKNAGGVIDPTSRANHSGTQTSATISDLAATVQGYRLDQFAAPSAPLSAGGQRIINAATPTAAGDVCTKSYVDNLVNGTDWKASVRAATTASITQSGVQTVDGVSLLAGDRCLCKNQATASQNGIFIVQSGAWTRAPDADVGLLTAGAACMVTEGTVNQDTQWRLLTDDPISVGSTSLTFAQIGAATSYTAGTGISIAGNVVSVLTSVVTTKYAATFGDGATLAYVITHALNTLDVIVSVYQISDGAEIECDILRTGVNTITLGFAVAPTANSLRVVAHG
jgi:hypothetical protein